MRTARELPCGMTQSARLPDLKSAVPLRGPQARPRIQARPESRGRAARLALDLVERATVAVVFLWLVVRLAPGLHVLNLGYLISEGLVVIFVLCRRAAREVDTSPWGVGSAFLGTLLPLFVSPGGSLLAPLGLCAALIATGIGLAFSAKLMLNRRFGVAPANRGVQIGGPYRIVRHPMYVGYMTAQIGLLLGHACVWNFLILGVDWAIQALRIVAEERVLQRDPDYRAYMAAVRWRLLPGVL